MALIFVQDKVSSDDLEKALEEYGNYIKIVADLKSGYITIGGMWHADGEKLLLEKGSDQKKLWGGGIDIESKTVDYNSLINIRPTQNNSGMEILDPTIRKTFEQIVKKKFGI